jgi:hypothetical protein
MNFKVNEVCKIARKGFGFFHFCVNNKPGENELR